MPELLLQLFWFKFYIDYWYSYIFPISKFIYQELNISIAHMWCNDTLVNNSFGNGLLLDGTVQLPRLYWRIVTLRLRQNDCDFTDENFKCILLNENEYWMKMIID